MKSARANVLVVEDNGDMRTAISSFLRDNGYIVHSASSAELALSKKLHEQSDVAIVDISLPGMTGLELTSELKQSGYGGPIIAITSRDTIEDKVIGLEIGMDDYLVKPFDLRELLARINAQLRIKGVHHDFANVSTKHFKLEPKRHKFFVNGIEQKLTLVEFRLMLKLMQNNHATVTTQDLIESAWAEDAAITTPPIRIHISNLRGKVGDTDFSTIVTIPGVGYQLND